LATSSALVVPCDLHAIAAFCTEFGQKKQMPKLVDVSSWRMYAETRFRLVPRRVGQVLQPPERKIEQKSRRTFFSFDRLMLMSLISRSAAAQRCCQFPRDLFEHLQNQNTGKFVFCIQINLNFEWN